MVVDPGSCGGSNFIKSPEHRFPQVYLGHGRALRTWGDHSTVMLTRGSVEADHEPVCRANKGRRTTSQGALACAGQGLYAIISKSILGESRQKSGPTCEFNADGTCLLCNGNQSNGQAGMQKPSMRTLPVGPAHRAIPGRADPRHFRAISDSESNRRGTGATRALSRTEKHRPTLAHSGQNRQELLTHIPNSQQTRNMPKDPRESQPPRIRQQNQKYEKACKQRHIMTTKHTTLAPSLHAHTTSRPSQPSHRKT